MCALWMMQEGWLIPCNCTLSLVVIRRNSDSCIKSSLYSGGTHAEISEILKWSLTIKIELHFGILRFHADDAADEIRIEMKLKWTRNGREMGYSE